MKWVFRQILESLYSYTAQSMIFAVMATFVLVYFKKTGVKKGIKYWFEELKNNKNFVWKFLFFFYAYIIAVRTLFDRTMVWDSLTHLMKGWTVDVQDNGVIIYEGIENIMLFVPLIFLLYYAFEENIYRETIGKNIIRTLEISFGVSLFIEFNQLIFRIGTFQIADLVYNTLGGVLGFSAYAIVRAFFKMNSKKQ